jgi:hypothetical protein
MMVEPVIIKLFPTPEEYETAEKEFLQELGLCIYPIGVCGSRPISGDVLGVRNLEMNELPLSSMAVHKRISHTALCADAARKIAEPEEPFAELGLDMFGCRFLSPQPRMRRATFKEPPPEMVGALLLERYPTAKGIANQAA